MTHMTTATASPILPTDSTDEFENGLSYLGWIRAEHGRYLHDDGSTIEVVTGVRKGTNVQVRVAVRYDSEGRQVEVNTDLYAVIEHHRLGLK